MNYYERHIGDYLKDTAHLSLLEHGVYTRLLDVYYTREGGFTAAECGRLIGAKSKDERAALAVVLAEFFVADGDMLNQARCDVEIARFKEKQRKAKASADARWSHTERNANASPNAMRTHSEGNALQSPVSSLQTPDTKGKEKSPASPWLTVADLQADGLSAEVAEAWIAHRRAKKAKLTPLAWSGFKAEVAKAGWAMEAAVLKAISRHWTTFEAAWVDAPKRGAMDEGAVRAERAKSTAGAARLLGFNTGETIDG